MQLTPPPWVSASVTSLFALPAAPGEAPVTDATFIVADHRVAVVRSSRLEIYDSAWRLTDTLLLPATDVARDVFKWRISASDRRIYAVNPALDPVIVALPQMTMDVMLSHDRAIRFVDVLASELDSAWLISLQDSTLVLYKVNGSTEQVGQLSLGALPSRFSVPSVSLFRVRDDSIAVVIAYPRTAFVVANDLSGFRQLFFGAWAEDSVRAAVTGNQLLAIAQTGRYWISLESAPNGLRLLRALSSDSRERKIDIPYAMGWTDARPSSCRILGVVSDAAGETIVAVAVHPHDGSDACGGGVA